MGISVRFIAHTSLKTSGQPAQTRLDFRESYALAASVERFKERIVSRDFGRFAMRHAWTGRLESTLSRVIG